MSSLTSPSYRTSRGMASTSCANATSAELMCIPLAVLSIGGVAQESAAGVARAERRERKGGWEVEGAVEEEAEERVIEGRVGGRGVAGRVESSKERAW